MSAQNPRGRRLTQTGACIFDLYGTLVDIHTDENQPSLWQRMAGFAASQGAHYEAEEMRKKIGNICFDAVFSSPLRRAVRTAAILGGVGEDEVIIDQRLIEADFGPYELKRYWLLGPAMTLYWMFPEVFPAPEGVESVSSMVRRSASFLGDLEKEPYENVLVACHGGIMRALSGHLADRKNGIMWRPAPHNCEIRVFEAENGKHRMVRRITDKEDAE